ncbi:hypothetical protein IW261DRAFT_1599353 [Armillaria novae-zelandiae]|uniref:Uncharacterized protein n=1 Tax=Armillaria novae-zelandiae TaxID=153914 RepID=A0AA39N9J5_9AGAR|nr:hypothetical protein IW261DRAFT_1599353 [Armillaria novae-zelandiae]
MLICDSKRRERRREGCRTSSSQRVTRKGGCAILPNCLLPITTFYGVLIPHPRIIHIPHLRATPSHQGASVRPLGNDERRQSFLDDLEPEPLVSPADVMSLRTLLEANLASISTTAHCVRPRQMKMIRFEMAQIQSRSRRDERLERITVPTSGAPGPLAWVIVWRFYESRLYEGHRAGLEFRDAERRRDRGRTSQYRAGSGLPVVGREYVSPIPMSLARWVPVPTVKLPDLCSATGSPQADGLHVPYPIHPLYSIPRQLFARADTFQIV